MSKKNENEEVKAGCAQQNKPSAAEEKDIRKPETAAEAADNKEEKPTEPDEQEKLKAEVADLKDKYLRQAAEFDNYRKRVLREKSELILNGGEKVMKSLLPVIDDFERSLANISKSDDKETLKQGVDLVYRKLLKTLEEGGLKAIDTADADFDTDFHEAVAMIPAADDTKKGKVVDCVQKGYTMNGKVIRHAKVAVGQ